MAHPQQSTAMPSGAESPALGVTVSGSVQKYAIKKKKVLNAEESELFELTQAAGITIDQEVFKIIVDLLKMNVAPLAVFQTLKAMCAGQRITETSAGDASTAMQASAAPQEPRVRTKTSQSHGEKGGRDGSSQRVPRQPSASRGPKSGKSSGSSSSSSQLTSS
ncbi:mitotic-spindle organizing protein 2-like [Scleropages formosus]|uniref:Mitotic spindle organizing protein 2B n=1 Tax=Scleropages formosus TaxID=113540 RepID=A0A0P7UG89_SCLFO|nr:mitotic-spindle organizing protein 2-like isoform X2 [Scleropages formosus]KPP58178.1 mitotic-spindle organizing protein 2-like [Scleropages formosus]